ncbi:helix-turn-helix transcriptional regulator [Ruminococcus sp.]|jgi:transcriptional regulator with XRE-family HTH domain|uniref:helix-turn-helix domain-containing protein n=1 Tax=Ruminococcus sp. TaxID=41978 RepID=UPI001B523017|nr:helix-turn-helix transcriptional regulator [Ruminococcus sp.]MBP5431083.1 helix-turn-helix transcriptional regulator [Ruminococcus sp.]
MDKGERIKSLRESKNITQTELAEMIGTTKQNVYKYENGIITNIPSDKIELMAERFDVSPAYIMGWSTDIPNNEKSAPVTADESALLHHLQKTYADDDLEVLSSLNRNQAAEIVEQAKKMKSGE